MVDGLYVEEIVSVIEQCYWEVGTAKTMKRGRLIYEKATDHMTANGRLRLNSERVVTRVETRLLRLQVMMLTQAYEQKLTQ